MKSEKNSTQFLSKKTQVTASKLPIRITNMSENIVLQEHPEYYLQFSPHKTEALVFMGELFKLTENFVLIRQKSLNIVSCALTGQEIFRIDDSFLLPEKFCLSTLSRNNQLLLAIQRFAPIDEEPEDEGDYRTFDGIVFFQYDFQSKKLTEKSFCKAEKLFFLNDQYLLLNFPMPLRGPKNCSKWVSNISLLDYSKYLSIALFDLSKNKISQFLNIPPIKKIALSPNSQFLSILDSDTNTFIIRARTETNDKEFSYTLVNSSYPCTATVKAIQWLPDSSGLLLQDGSCLLYFDVHAKAYSLLNTDVVRISDVTLDGKMHVVFRDGAVHEYIANALQENYHKHRALFTETYFASYRKQINSILNEEMPVVLINIILNYSIEFSAEKLAFHQKGMWLNLNIAVTKPIERKASTITQFFKTWLKPKKASNTASPSELISHRAC